MSHPFWFGMLGGAILLGASLYFCAMAAAANAALTPEQLAAQAEREFHREQSMSNWWGPN